MAPRPKSKQRLRGVLRVYQRPMRGGALWWWCAVGRARHALGLDASTTRDEAYRVACERHGAGALTARDPGAAPEATLVEILATYRAEQEARYKPRAWQSKRYILAAFVEWMIAHGAAKPSQITDEVLSRWIAARASGGAQNGTINRALIAARVWLRWAAGRTPPLCRATALERARNLREIGRTTHPVVPSPAEWRRLVAELAADPCPDRNDWGEMRERHRANARGAALLVASAVETGMRFDELRHVRAEDVEPGAVYVRAHGGWSPKSWQERRIPVADSTGSTLRALVAWRDVAVGLNGTRLVLGEHWINDRIDAAWSRMGIADEAPRLHDARRTYATASVRAGAGMDRVRVLLGHRDVSTTERYVGRYRTDVDAPAIDLGVADVLEAPIAAVIPLRRRG